MNQERYEYKFAQKVSADEIHDSLLLAVLAVQSLHGEIQVRLDAEHEFDFENRTCCIDGTTAVGHDLNRLFLGFILRQFGEDGFTVDRIDTASVVTARSNTTVPA